MKIYLLAFLLFTSSVNAAMPTDELVQETSAQVFKVYASKQKGDGFGSAVVIAKDHLVTNCHVIAGATSVSVVHGQDSYSVSAIKPDWEHDVCLLKVSSLNAPVARIGRSTSLKYNDVVFNMGYPSIMPVVQSSVGVVKGLYSQDGGNVIRTSSQFRMGQSGGALFDDSGSLVGIITLKSPGKDAFYFNMPVEWAMALLDTPDQMVGADSSAPFWAKNPETWPFFMQVVLPLQSEDWEKLEELSNKWVKADPWSSEAWYHRGVALYHQGKDIEAEANFIRAVGLNGSHNSAMFLLAVIAEESGKHMEAVAQVFKLAAVDKEMANSFNVKFDLQ